MSFSNLPHPHVISLSWKGERRARFYNRAENQGVSGVEWFPAIDGNQMPELPLWASGNPGAYGCLHSHVALYRRALANGWPALTVFEDDASIDCSAADLLAAINLEGDGADIIALHRPISGCVGAWAYVIFPNLMREIVRRVDIDPFPEGLFAHIDQLILHLDGQGWRKVHVQSNLVSHVPRDCGETTIGWFQCYRPTANEAVPTSRKLAQTIESRARILIGISSCSKNSDRRRAVRDTWLAELPVGMVGRFFVANGTTEDAPDIVVLDDTRDDYEHLPEKVVSFFRHALDHFEFDWLFKCDDDTYLVPERLAQLIDNRADVIGDELIAQDGLSSGGGGFLISRHWVERIASNPEVPRKGSVNKVVIGAILSEGGKAIASQWLRRNERGGPRPDNSLVTSHPCSPRKLRAIHAVLRSEPTEIIDVAHPGWHDRLNLYSDGHFCRHSTPCMGTWKEDAAGGIQLDWFDWTAELLRPEIGVSQVIEGSPRSYFCDNRKTEEIVVNLSGGLGDQMFQYAHGLALSRRLEARLRLALAEDCAHFQLEELGLSVENRAVVPESIFIENHDYREFAEWASLRSIAFSQERRVAIVGAFKHAGYFGSIADDLRSTLIRLRKQTGKVSNQFALHLRRSDVESLEKLGLSKESYFNSAIALAQKIKGDLQFLILTDDPAWCRGFLKNIHQLTFEHASGGIEDLAVLLSCNGFVLGGDSLSWWAAWLSPGLPVIAPNLRGTSLAIPESLREWIILPPQGI